MKFDFDCGASAEVHEDGSSLLIIDLHNAVTSHGEPMGLTVIDPKTNAALPGVQLRVLRKNLPQVISILERYVCD